MKYKYAGMIQTLGLVLLLSTVEIAYAQQNQPSTIVGQTQSEASKIALYKSSPVWKDMLDDPNVNFFEVQKAFTLFWEGREMPLEEDAIIGETRRLKNNFISRTFNARELREQAAREALAFDCKKYHWWLIKTEPFIKDDGSIMSNEEQLELWKKHYQELNEEGNK